MPYPRQCLQDLTEAMTRALMEATAAPTTAKMTNTWTNNGNLGFKSIVDSVDEAVCPPILDLLGRETMSSQVPNDTLCTS